jgi:hypothetical protein
VVGYKWAAGKSKRAMWGHANLHHGPRPRMNGIFCCVWARKAAVSLTRLQLQRSTAVVPICLQPTLKQVMILHLLTLLFTNSFIFRNMKTCYSHVLISRLRLVATRRYETRKGSKLTYRRHHSNDKNNVFVTWTIPSCYVEVL